jgi:ABC-type transporter Mla MlaB component
MNKKFRYYMHDGPDAISFELAGHLSDGAARELEQARRTASSTAGGRSLIVDLSYVTGVDTEGRAMLRGWYGDGVQLVAKVPLAKAILASITRQSPAMIAETARSQTWRPVLVASFFAMVSLFAPARTLAAGLSPEAVPCARTRENGGSHLPGAASSAVKSHGAMLTFYNYDKVSRPLRAS